MLGFIIIIISILIIIIISIIIIIIVIIIIIIIIIIITIIIITIIIIIIIIIFITSTAACPTLSPSKSIHHSNHHPSLPFSIACMHIVYRRHVPLQLYAFVDTEAATSEIACQVLSLFAPMRTHGVIATMHFQIISILQQQK
jgi:hypothetical protein